jgi:hypothetical protein
LDPEEFSTQTAGLVLLWPYIPPLFTRMALMQDNQFVGAAAQGKAVRTLQFLVGGELNGPDDTLALEKLLCGWPLSQMVGQFQLGEKDLMLIEGLFEAVLGSWPPLNNTSPQGLQDSFLQRGGAIAVSDTHAQMTVETAPLDLLLNQLAWPISPIEFPWMPLPLTVTWR